MAELHSVKRFQNTLHVLLLTSLLTITQSLINKSPNKIHLVATQQTLSFHESMMTLRERDTYFRYRSPLTGGINHTCNQRSRTKICGIDTLNTSLHTMYPVIIIYFRCVSRLKYRQSSQNCLSFDGSYNLFQILCCKSIRRVLTRKFAINHSCQQRGNSGEERVLVDVSGLYSLNYVMQLSCFYFKVYDCVSLKNINEAHEGNMEKLFCFRFMVGNEGTTSALYSLISRIIDKYLEMCRVRK